MLNICFMIMYMVMFSLKFDVAEVYRNRKEHLFIPLFLIVKGAGWSTNYPPDHFISLRYYHC